MSSHFDDRTSNYDNYRNKGRGQSRDPGSSSDSGSGNDRKSSHHRSKRSDSRFRRASSRRRSRDSSEESSHSRDRRRSRGKSHSSRYSRLRSSSEFSSDSGERNSTRRENERHSTRPRQRSPPAPKMETFSGKTRTWDAFIFQFRQLSHRYRWSERDKRDRLIACLRGNAVKYISTKPRKICSKYRDLRDSLDKRYGVLEVPSTARRQLVSMRQEETETLEDFADRVLCKATEGYPEVTDDCLQDLAKDHFLKGCKDKAAGYATAERKPGNLYEALEDIRDASANLKVFGRPSVSARQVTFADSGDERHRPEESRLTKEDRSLIESLRVQLAEMATKNDKFVRNRSPIPARGSRSRSPSPNSRCFNCNQQGHVVKDCPKAQLCFECGKEGHWARECPQKVANGSAARASTEQRRSRSPPSLN